MGNYFSRMGCCRADDDENGDYTHASAKRHGEETPIASSSKPVDLHVIERQPENGYKDRAPSFEQINQLLASPTKIGAHLQRDIPPPPKPVLTVFPKPQHVPPGFADDSVIRELKERFKHRSATKHISLDDTTSNSEDDDRQPILSKRGNRPSPKIYVPSYTTEVRPLENLESRYRDENITIESTSTPLVGEVAHPIVEVKLSPVIEITSNVSEVVETQPEVAQKCVYVEQPEPKHLITANIKPAEEVLESILVDSTSDVREESILENLRNQAISLEENDKPRSVPLDYINQGFNHSSGSLHKEEKTVVEKDSNGGYKVFKQCFISTLVHDNEGFTDSSQNIPDNWTFGDSDIPDYDPPLPSPPESGRPKFQISANSSYTTLDEDQLVQVRVSDNAANKRYSQESSDSFSEMSQEQSETLLPKNYLHEDDEDDEEDDDDDDDEDDEDDDEAEDADDEDPFPDVLFPSLNSNLFLNNKRSLDSESEHLIDVSTPESSGSHNLPPEPDALVSERPMDKNGSLLMPQQSPNEETTLTPHPSPEELVDNMSGHECPLEISDFVDQTIASCLNAVQDSIVEGSLFSDRPLSPNSREISNKHVLAKMMSVEDDTLPKSSDSIDTDHSSGPPSDLPAEGERIFKKRVSFDHEVKSISPPGFSSSSSPDKDSEEESTRIPFSGKIMLEKYHHPNLVDELPSPPEEFPSPPDELLDFRELLDTEGFSKEEFVGASEAAVDDDNDSSIPTPKLSFHEIKSIQQARSLDLDENTHLLASTGRSKSLDESSQHSFGDSQLAGDENAHHLVSEDQHPLIEETEACDYLQNVHDCELLDQSNTSDYYSSGDREQHSLEYAQQSDFLYTSDKKNQDSPLDEAKPIIGELIDFETEIDTSVSSHDPQPESHTSHVTPRTTRAGSFEFEDVAKDMSSFKSDFSLDTSSDTEPSSNLFSYSDIAIDPLSHNEPPVTLSGEPHGNLKTENQVSKHSDVDSSRTQPEQLHDEKMSQDLDIIALPDPNKKKVILESHIGYPISKAADLRKSAIKSETLQSKTRNVEVHKRSRKCLDLDKDDTSEGELSDQEVFEVSRTTHVPVSSYPDSDSEIAEKFQVAEVVESATQETGELISFVDLESGAFGKTESETRVDSLETDKNDEFQVMSDLETGESSLLPNAGLRRQSTLKTSEMFSDGLMDELRHSLSPESDTAEIPRITMTSPNGSPTSSRSSSAQSSLSDVSESEHKDAAHSQQTFSLRFRQPAADYVSFRNRLETTYVSLENVLLRGNIVLGTVKVKSLGHKRSVFLRCTFNAWQSSVDVPATYTPSSFPNQYETYSFALTMPVSFQDKMHVIFAVCYKTDDLVYWDNNDGLNYEIVSSHTVVREMLSSFQSSNQETVPRPYPGVLKKGASAFESDSSWNPAAAIKETRNIRKSAICLNVSKPATDYLTFKSRLERDFVALEHVYNKDFMLTGSIKIKSIEGEKKVFIRCSFDSWVTFIDVPASLSKGSTCPYESYTFEMNVPTVFNTKMQFAVCYEVNGNVYWDNNADPT